MREDAGDSRSPLLARGTPLGYLVAIAVTVAATGIGYLMIGRIELSNLIMVYLGGVAVVASRFGPREAALCSILSVAAFDFLFVHPHGTFAVSDTQYVLTFVVMLLVSLLISTLTLQVRRQAKEAEERDRHTAEIQRLNEIERMKNTLLTSISHDLRTPLTSIAGAAESLRQSAGDSAALIDTIYEESQRLNLQVQNLLDMTRLQWGEIRANLEWQSIEEMVGSALARAEEQLRPRKVLTELAGDLGLVLADAVLMDRLLANLLQNCAFHTPPTATVTVRAWKSGNAIMLEVSDDGPGIPEGLEDSIFMPFNQVGRGSGGFGLGLAICRAIVALHHGQIRASRSPCGGASIRIELPSQGEQPVVPLE